MESLSTEVRRVVDNDYKLKFTVPTTDQLEHMRRIHRDRTREELEDAEKLEQTLEKFAELAERGELSLEQLPLPLREKLRGLFRGEGR